MLYNNFKVSLKSPWVVLAGSVFVVLTATGFIYWNKDPLPPDRNDDPTICHLYPTLPPCLQSPDPAINKRLVPVI